MQRAKCTLTYKRADDDYVAARARSARPRPNDLICDRGVCMRVFVCASHVRLRAIAVRCSRTTPERMNSRASTCVRAEYLRTRLVCWIDAHSHLRIHTDLLERICSSSGADVQQNWCDFTCAQPIKCACAALVGHGSDDDDDAAAVTRLGNRVVGVVVVIAGAVVGAAAHVSVTSLPTGHIYIGNNQQREKIM